MTNYIQVVTNDGKNNLLKTGFAGSQGALPFGYMALGKSTTDPTEASTSLVSECSSQDGSYSRLPLTAVFNTDLNRVTLDATFGITNITETTEINEVGIVDTDTLLSGTFFCICRVPTMSKNSSNQLRIVITATLESV